MRSSARRRRRAWRAVGWLVALNATVAAAFTGPRLVERQRGQQRAGELDAAVVEARAQAADLSARAEAARRNRVDARDFYDSVACPAGDGFLTLLQRLESRVRDAGLAPEQRSYAREDVAGAGVDQYDIELPARGSYSQLVRLIDALERADDFVIVESIALSELGDGGQMQVRLSAYCRRDDGAPSV